MFLQRLLEYSNQLDLPPTLYASAPVRYIVELDAAGHPLTPEPIDTADPASPLTRRGQPRLVPRVQRSVKIRPLLLADNAEYTLGLARETSRPERVAECHAAYMEQLERCAAATNEPAVSAVYRFLEGDPVSQLRLPDDYDRGESITFRVDGQWVVDLPSVQAFWAAENDPDADPDRPAPTMQCLICGAERPVLRRLQGKIKRVPGGQTSGTAIISANADAFLSYGLEASLIAPTCAVCGERFTKALNSLLADRAHHIALGGSVLVFWTRETHPFSLRELLDTPQPEQVRELVESLRSGRPSAKVDDTAFYAAVLSGSGGRAVVRDWIDTTVAGVKRNLGRWFRCQAIVDAYGQPARPLGIYALAAATVRDARKDLAPPTPRALWRAALTGTPLPAGMLAEAVRRNRAEQGVTRQRAALIKLVLTSGQPGQVKVARPGRGDTAEEDAMVQLDSDNPNPAYRCGRLLAVIEEAQRLAQPGIKATVVDRFYGSASTAPASVFGRLLQGVRPHLAKLRRDRPAAYVALQARLEDIQAGLDGFPRVLTLEEQGLFALGYYHQRAWDRAQALEAKARKAAGMATSAVDDGVAELADVDSQVQAEEE
jgi:CRISPR-associated protein Csd1